MENNRSSQLEAPGSLPSKEWLARMEQLRPGATEIILRDFTEERRHQREMQRRAIELDAAVVRDQSRYQNRRLLIAGILALVLIGAGFVMVLLNKTVYGFALLVAEISTLVAAFLARRAWLGGPEERE